MSSSPRKKVFVGLSGGVDSSVSAALLSARIGGSALGGKSVRYDVTGVFIRVWQPEFWQCSWRDDRLDAMRVCAKLAIPFVELDLEKEYKKEVVDYMIREYKAGKTPNPDVMCNRFIKFGGFYKWAMENGADFVATGHYARIDHDTNTLMGANDTNKDQSYFLWQIRKDQLPHILFPVGGMQKPEVRKLARKFGLITANKKDSQGLCFIGKVDMKEFLSHYIKPKRGKVVDKDGKVIGEHSGAFLHTIGERLSGLANLDGRRDLLNHEGPLYVTAKDMEKNTLTVSPKSPEGETGGMVKEVRIKDCSWLIQPRAGKTYGARVRYRQPLQSCRFEAKSSKVLLEKAQTVAAGQSLVLYDGDVLLGGGIIV